MVNSVLITEDNKMEGVADKRGIGKAIGVND
jgi:hypothetical protein